MDLQNQLLQIMKNVIPKIKKTHNLNELDQIKVDILGKKGSITNVLHKIHSLDSKSKPVIGKLANEIRNKVTKSLEEQRLIIKKYKMNNKIQSQKIDVTLPSRKLIRGRRHVIYKIIDDLEELFLGMGYKITLGYEVEDEHHNFEMLNIPANHPARDMQDTFYIKDNILLRTHMSPDEARELEIHDFSKGPLKMISPGIVYRRDDDDATHSHQFFQMEGQVIYTHITMADLKGTLEYALHHIFGSNRKIRFRPSYFPFTEPSIEVDISCSNCDGHGCGVCKNSGWVEALGAGMTHPNVLKSAGVDTDIYGGFAFGIGIDRLAMLKYHINDIREFYLNDIRFLHQF